MKNSTRKEKREEKQRVDYWNPHRSTNELFRAVHNNNLELAKKMLDEGADIDGIDESSEFAWTPLLIAFHLRRDEIFIFLIRRGANRDYRLTDGRNLAAIENNRINAQIMMAKIEARGCRKKLEGHVDQFEENQPRV